MGYGFAIDRGGTFTDVYVKRPDGTVRTLKLLSEDRESYRDAPTEAIRRILEEETGVKIPRGSSVPTENISWIRMGTTVATNALLERKGERTALIVTKGFKDLLFIGNQSRPNIFDLNIRMPEVLYEVVYEVNERVIVADKQCQLHLSTMKGKTVNGEEIIIEKQINMEEIEATLKRIQQSGIQSLAVAFLHSFNYPDHEKAVGELALKMGFKNVSLSSAVMPMVKIVPRGNTACADAYLTPKIQEYIENFKSGFVNRLDGVVVQFMQSDGGLCPVERFMGSRAILSGPAAGVVGISLTSYFESTGQPVIGFDMGGTSTDVSRFAGRFEHIMETTTAGITIQAPQLSIHTVASGGGSRLFYRHGLFAVGPESSGADPGPVCYRKNGYLSVTDANAILGRIVPDFFPKIFGPNGNEPLDRDASVVEMEKLVKEISAFHGGDDSFGRKVWNVKEAALGFIEVANEAMCRAVRSITQAKGYDTSQHVLACFGGAGGQHACAVAKALGIKTVLIHRHASILSAYGLAYADAVQEAQEPVGKVYSKELYDHLSNRVDTLKEKCRLSLKDMGFSEKSIHYEIYLNMRYSRTDCALMCCSPAGWNGNFDCYGETFEKSYKREFGFTLPNRDIIVDDVRIRGLGKSHIVDEVNEMKEVSNVPTPETVVDCFFKVDKAGRDLKTAVYDLCKLKYGHEINGPAIIVDANRLIDDKILKLRNAENKTFAAAKFLFLLTADMGTILIEPTCKAVITNRGDVQIHIQEQKKTDIGTDVDTIQLSIFSHRFMSIAEQMGHVLQRTSISTNIKERLDFSCALFTSDGGLVANAPHIPVHLGGMQATVKYQIKSLGEEGLSEGDVILCNHPKAGGSHLPDLTVITPVFYKNSRKPVFFVANRGHHADIGGLVPGSMPPHSTCLEQEGATFVSFKIVEKGIFQEDELVAQLKAPGEVAGCSGSRNIADNLSDLKAQIAANQQGVSLVNELIDSYGLPVVQAYMTHIQDNAEFAVRRLLTEVGRKQLSEAGYAKLQAADYMDDGTPIHLTVEISAEKGDAKFNFEGTGPEVLSSCNAPPAVTMAAVIYCLRCLVGSDIPLNQGCLVPITIKVPQGTILSPHETAAVVGGNVLTSQRICDVIFRAFNAVAASQGCMNNISFGDDVMGGYYETVAGGSGAGPGFHGRSAVHTHMTNTRITDPEILELRYPVILREFGLRSDSGGKGRWCGGDGCKRFLQFRRPLKLSVLCERRAFAPYGLEGGEDGARGLNLLHRKDGRLVNIGGKNTISVEAGDIFKLYTPGGGGYGRSV